jgi:hypothetical protein
VLARTRLPTMLIGARSSFRFQTPAVELSWRAIAICLAPVNSPALCVPSSFDGNISGALRTRSPCSRQKSAFYRTFFCYLTGLSVRKQEGPPLQACLGSSDERRPCWLWSWMPQSGFQSGGLSTGMRVALPMTSSRKPPFRRGCDVDIRVKSVSLERS